MGLLCFHRLPHSPQRLHVLHSLLHVLAHFMIFIFSPNNISQQNMNNMANKEDIKWKLQIIFVYYTSYADRNNFKLLKQQNYRRFLIDSETVKTQSSLVHYDIAYQKLSHSAIIFKDFLKLIPDIAELVFKTQARSHAFNSYIHKHIEPLFFEIIQKSQFGQDIKLALNANIDEGIQKKLLKLIITEKSYNEYVSNPMQGKDVLYAFECFSNFLKDFQICPQLVSKSLVYVIFLSIMKEKNQYEPFNLDDFVRSIIIISEVSCRKLSTSQLCPNTKIIKLLERMEISAGFDKVSKKIMYETAISPSFLKGFLDQKILEDGCLEKLDRNLSRVHPSSIRHKNCNDSLDFDNLSRHKESRKQELKNENYQTVEHLITEQSQSLSQQFKQIKLAFEELCQFGQVANSKTLKSFKIKKLFERIGLTSLVGQAWLDIQIVNLQRCSETGKIQFPQFLELLSLVSKKIGSPFEEMLNLVVGDQQLNQKILKDTNSPRRINQYSEDDQKLLKQIIQSCEKQAEKIYRKYSLDTPLMGFTQFSKMMYDFQIFPVIISKNKLYQIFSTLNDVRQETEPNSDKKQKKTKQVQNYLKDKKKIDFTGFLMGLIEVGQEICDDSLEVGQKLIILLQKINESEGYKRISNGSLVQGVRKKFAKYYMKNFHKQKQQAEDFDSLLNSFS